jgi:multidrug efflux system membrane fusion protein
MPLERERGSAADQPRSASPEASGGPDAPGGPEPPGPEPPGGFNAPGGAPPPARIRRRNRIRSFFRLFLLVAAGVILFLLLHPRQTAPPPRPQPGVAITAEPAKTGDMNVYITALGTVTPVSTITVYSQVTGELKGVYYQQGQMVKKGDPLVDIDPRQYQANLTTAMGQLARDQQALESAKIDLDRYRKAYAGNAIAQQTMVDQEYLVAQLEGAVKADEGAVLFNKTQLSYTHITAPISGRVGLRLVDPGNLVFAGNSTILVAITQMQPITVVFAVSEADLPEIEKQLRSGHVLAVDAFDRTNSIRLAAGRMDSLNNLIDTTTGTVKFRADFSNANLALFPNQFVNARLLLKTLHRATIVPTAAVQYNGTNAFVYVVTPQQTVKVQGVTPVASEDDRTALTGIAPGEMLATSGFDRLENGVKVSIRNRPKTAPKAPSRPAPSRRVAPQKETPPTTDEFNTGSANRTGSAKGTNRRSSRRRK